MYKPYGIKGFSLLELSVVLLIIGIFIVTASTGYMLVKEARLRSIITEAQGYISAINLFEDKYSSLPGDFPNASDVWGTTCATTPTDCNGNGDGIITYSLTSLLQNEALRAWQHLSLAQMIKGNYTGVATVAGQTDIGVNAPESEFNKAGWCFYAFGRYNPPDQLGNYIQIAGFSAGSPPNITILTPQEAYNIDAKIDDGYPRNGLVWADWLSNNCFTTQTTTSPYNLGSNSISCIPLFIFRKDLNK